MRTAFRRGALAAIFLVGTAAAAAAQNRYENSTSNWDNSPYNWRNSPYNWRNSEFNWDNSPYNWQNTQSNVANRPTGPNAIVDPKDTASYSVRGPTGGLLRFDADGNRLPLDPLTAKPREATDQSSDQGAAQ
jgi:hypothetical protein